MKKGIIILLAVFFITGCALQKPNALDDFFSSREIDEAFSGSVLVAKKGEILTEQGYGFRDRAAHTANTAASKHLIASLSKQITAAAILQLDQQGDLDINDFISDYNGNVSFFHGDEITIYQLLTHTSGYPHNYYCSNYPDPITCFAEYYDQTLANGSLSLLFTPGTQFQYSNFGYQTLARIIELVSHMSYHEYIQTHIFDVLGMSASGTEYDVNQDDLLALGYNAVDGDQHLPLYIPTYYSSGAGSLVSTVGDFNIWNQSLYHNTILAEAATNIMFTPYINYYGCGWFITSYTYNGKTRILHYHDGGWVNNDGGFTTVIYRFPEDDLLIVIFCNVKSYDPMFDWLPDILDIILD